MTTERNYGGPVPWNMPHATAFRVVRDNLTGLRDLVLADILNEPELAFGFGEPTAYAPTPMLDRACAERV